LNPRRRGDLLKLLLSKLYWREKPVPLDLPRRVVYIAECKQRRTQFLDRFEVPRPEQVLLQLTHSAPTSGGWTM
jgi:hypothetical protein